MIKLFNTARNYKNYGNYQQLLTTNILIPFFQKHGIELKGKFIGDFGCGEGGVLTALVQEKQVRGLGIDLQIIQTNAVDQGNGIRFINGDILTINLTEKFNLILLRDVLEHVVDVKKALLTSLSHLSENGLIYISFPPYYSPFGGHQMWSDNIAQFIPYLHYIPEKLFFKCLTCKRHVYYKSFKEMRDDLLKIRRTRLTIAKMDQIIKSLGLLVIFKGIYLFRPEFRWRFKLPTIKNFIFGNIPILREISSTGVIYLLNKSK